MSVRTAVNEYLRRRIALWERRRTERYISNLPTEIRKDIGWPGGGGSDPSIGDAQKSFFERRW